MKTKEPYKKCLQDEVDWKEIDQLHGAVGQISNFCFETKKSCVTVEFVVLGLIATFTNKKLDDSIFLAALTIPTLFLLLDSIGYYYQRKLRNKMEGCKIKIINRNKEKSSPHIISLHGEFFSNLDGNQVERPTALWSIVNHSMWLYYIMISIGIALWIAFKMGLIK